MEQSPLLENIPLDKIVNVAKVPLRSPFRYPGGKTWLVPRIRRWLAKETKPAEFIEPFAGGGIVSLTVAFEDLAAHVTMVELDEEIAAVWKTILDKEKAEWLVTKIVEFDPTPESVEALLSRLPLTTEEIAFRTIVKNRVNRGGILAPGAGMLKSGENEKGLKSRWYPATLKRRILDIADVCVRKRITFIQGDGFEVIKKNARRTGVVFFIDPPYTAGSKKSGRRLYKYSDIDHKKLFKLAKKLAGDFLMTYSNDEEVLKLAQDHGFDAQPVAMKSTHHAEMTELLISKNLDWLREIKQLSFDHR